MAYQLTSLGIPISTQSPMMDVTQLAQGVQNARATSARRQAIVQQTAQAKQLLPLREQQLQANTAQMGANTQRIAQLTPAQVQIAQDQADALAAHTKLVAQNPLLNFGNNPIAQAVYLSQHPLGQPTQPQAPTVAMPSQIAQQPVQPQSLASTQAVPSVAQQPLQTTQVAAPSEPTNAATDPYTAVNKYATDFYHNYVQSVQPPTGADFGIQSNDPGTQALINQGLGGTQSYGDVRAKMLPVMIWQSEPAQVKNASIALGQGFGLTPTASARYFASGGTVKGLADVTGIPANTAQMIYTATNATLTRQQKIGMAAAGLNAVDKPVQQALAPFIQKNVFGFSTKAIKSMLAKGNQNQVANALGAAMVQREMFNLQVLRSGGTPSVDATEGLARTQFADKGHLDQLLKSRTITPQIYSKAMDFFNTHSNNMAKAQTLYVNQQGGRVTPGYQGQQGFMTPTPEALPATPKGMVKMRAPDGKIYHIPQDQVEQLRAIGGSVING